jgi:hypothetical protein
MEEAVPLAYSLNPSALPNTIVLKDLGRQCLVF